MYVLYESYDYGLVASYFICKNRADSNVTDTVCRTRCWVDLLLLWIDPVRECGYPQQCFHGG